MSRETVDRLLPFIVFVAFLATHCWTLLTICNLKYQIHSLTIGKAWASELNRVEKLLEHDKAVLNKHLTGHLEKEKAEKLVANIKGDNLDVSTVLSKMYSLQ